MIDLHTHSTYSDGTFSPPQLLDYAMNLGVNTLALTDHDTIDGVNELKTHAQKKEMRIIPGVELSINWLNKVIHVVGLNIDINDAGLLHLLKDQQEKRHLRALSIGDLLDKHAGIKNSYEKALALASGGLVARPHFAKVLIEEKICKDMKVAFNRYLKRGKCAYVRTNWVDLATGVEVLNNSGGVAVLAHPLKYKLTRTKLNELIEAFKAAGGQAMEIISGMSSNDEISHLSTLCQKFDLLASIGSDFHGESMTPHSMKRLRLLPKTCSALMDSPIMEKIK